MPKSGRIELALLRALRTAPVLPMDAAAVELTKAYAQSIDSNRALLGQLGGGLKALLVEFGMTPRARAALLKDEKAPAPPQGDPLDELRSRRAKKASA